MSRGSPKATAGGGGRGGGILTARAQLPCSAAAVTFLSCCLAPSLAVAAIALYRPASPTPRRTSQRASSYSIARLSLSLSLTSQDVAASQPAHHCDCTHGLAGSMILQSTSSDLRVEAGMDRSKSACIRRTQKK
jgi:hypothetical protein